MLWLQSIDKLSLVAIVAILMALFPIIPYPVLVIGGVSGAAFAPVNGTIST